MHLQSAWKKYGEMAFIFEILELTGDLQIREQYWMNSLNAYTDGFNLIALEYGVGALTIYDVVRWNTWKSNPEENQ